MARSFGSPIPRTSLPNLRVNRSLLASLANPRFSKSVGEAFGKAVLGPELRKEKKEDEAFFEGLLKSAGEGNTSAIGSMIAARGAEDRDLPTVLQGIGMMTSGAKQQGLITIDSNLDIYADPTRSDVERTAALTRAETLAFSNNIGMTPQNFQSLVNGAATRFETTLNNRAKSLVSANPQTAASEYTALFGSDEAWRVEKALQEQIATRASISNQSTAAFVASQQPEIARLETAIAQFQNTPVDQWDMDQLRSLFQQRFNIAQNIVDKGGEADPSKFIGGAERFYDAAYKVQDERNIRAQNEIDTKVATQKALLHMNGANQTELTSDQYIKRIRDASANAPVNLYADWKEDDWKDLEQQIFDSQQTKRERQELINNGRLADGHEEWLSKYPSYFDGDDEFTDALKTYRDPGTSPIDRIPAGTIVVAKIKAAKEEQRQNARSNANIKRRATDFLNAYLGAGDPDDPRYNPNLVVEGGFMQGDSVYDVIRRDKLTASDRYDDLVARIGEKIKDNPNADMRSTVTEAFAELYVRTPGEEGVQARQAVIDERMEITKEGIALRQEQHKKQTGEDLSAEEAAMLIQQDMANALQADADRMSAGIRSTRQRAMARGEDSFYAPSVDDLTEAASTMTGLDALDEFARENRARVGRIVRGEGIPVYDKAKNN